MTSKQQLKNIKLGLHAYKNYTGEYPKKLEDLIFDSGIKDWKKCLDADQLPKDPWDNKFFYKRRNNGYILLSFGADGKPGGEGLDADIVEERED